MRKRSKILATVLAALLVLSVGSVTAFAADVEESIIANAELGSVEAVVGAIDTESNGLYVAANEGYSADVNAGSINAGGYGVFAVSDDENSVVDITVTGDVSAAGNDAILVEAYDGADTNVEITGNVDSGDDDGLDVGVAGDNATANVTVTGNITADDDGMYVSASEGGQAFITVNGDIDTGYYGVNADSYSDGFIRVDVTGDITSEDETIYADASGKSVILISVNGDMITEDGNVYLKASEESTIIFSGKGNILAGAEESGPLTALYVRGESESSVAATLIGDIISSFYGADLYSSNGSTVFLLVDGDIASAQEGIYSNIFGEESIAEALVTGTISADGMPIALGQDEASLENFTLTVWRIIPNENGEIAGVGNYGWIFVDGDGDTLDGIGDGDGQELFAPTYEQSEAMEAKIQYIIKYVQPEEGAVLSVTDAEGNPLGNAYGFDYAFEGDKVLMKVELEDGYKLAGAFNGEDGEKFELIQDESGNYFIIVQKGGGVLLSVELEKEEAPVEPETQEEEKKADTVIDTPSQVASASVGYSTPPTGDSMTAYICGGIALFALIAAAVMFFVRRKMIK